MFRVVVYNTGLFSETNILARIKLLCFFRVRIQLFMLEPYNLILLDCRKEKGLFLRITHVISDA